MSDQREYLRETFNEDAELYDRARPGYPEAMFDDIVALSGIPPGGRILEIGSGTGQATLPFARRGYQMLAIDIGAQMVALARRRLAGFPNVRVEQGALEDYPLQPGSFDLAVSGTAFHWVDPAIGYARLADALRPGGVIALFWNKHVRLPGDEHGFFDEVQPLYERAWPDATPGFRLPYAAELPAEARAPIEASGLFGPVNVRRYEWRQVYDARAFVDLLNTYSDHRVLAPERREQLYHGIACLLNERYGGQVVMGYLTILYLAAVR
jgi:SAM-dependent methyltransferase